MFRTQIPPKKGLQVNPKTALTVDCRLLTVKKSFLFAAKWGPPPEEGKALPSPCGLQTLFISRITPQTTRSRKTCGSCCNHHEDVTTRERFSHLEVSASSAQQNPAQIASQ
jgi:hypothetical protein